MWSLNPLATTFQPHWRCYRQLMHLYSSITSTKSQSFCMTTFSASLTKLTSLLPQTSDWSCCVSRQILAPPLLWLQKHTDLRALYFAQFPDLRHQPRLANVTCPWSWRLYGINAATLHWKRSRATYNNTQMSVPLRPMAEWVWSGGKPAYKIAYHGLPTNKHKVADYNEQQGVTDAVPKQMCW